MENILSVCAHVSCLISSDLPALADPIGSEVPLAEVVVRVAYVRTPRLAAAYPQGNPSKLTCQSNQ